MTPPLAADDICARTQPECGVLRVLGVLEGKWTGLILRELLTGPRRFGELREALDGPSPKTLTERLRILEHHGIISRTIYAEVPPRVVYELTERGHGLGPVFDAMGDWGSRFPVTGTP